MKQIILAFVATTAFVVMSAARAVEGNPPIGTFGKLDHVFLIVMENQSNADILGNANSPFINHYARIANQATEYFAVGHPSAPNYLEIIGGSNFGLTSDSWPNWIKGGCTDHQPGSTGCVHAFTPIAVPGLDNAVVQTALTSTDCNGEVSVTRAPVPKNCALRSYPANAFTPKSIADQLLDRHLTWKSYQESLPTLERGVLAVNYSDGMFSNLSPRSVFEPGAIQMLYEVKHNPFAYFQNVQQGGLPGLSLSEVVDFDGPDGLWSDLQSPTKLPNLAFIVPNECHDMHGFVSGGPAICSAATAAERAWLMREGDAEVEKLVGGITASPSWKQGRNAIVLVWDENDFSNAANRVVLLVETNYATGGVQDSEPYDHFSLLRTLEAGFGLPCLNHACDASSKVMNLLFGGTSH